MAFDTTGILSLVDFSSERPSDISAAARLVFVNETPLLARLPRIQGNDEVFKINTYDVRTRSGYALGSAAAVDNANTSFTFVDATAFIVGDVLELGTERVEVTTVNNSTNVTVRRAVEGTTAATHANSATATLLYNSRTGSEVDQVGHRPVRSQITQVHQTFQFPVQVGGKAAAIKNVVLPPGFTDLIGEERATALTEMVRDIEYAMYVGKGDVPAAAGDRGKTKGLKTLIDSGNVTTSPTSASAYKPTDLIRDTFQKVINAGGNPDVLLCSPDYMSAFATWQYNIQQAQPGEYTAFGNMIDQMYVPFLGKPVMIWQSYQMPPFSACALSSYDLKLSYLRGETYYPRGRRGDAIEGDWIGDFALKLEHPKHHAWVEGVTGWAKQS